jgi:hypothetical protein
VLAVECAPIHGPDLPMLLPPSARTPPVRCLRSLNADVIDALADGYVCFNSIRQLDSIRLTYVSVYSGERASDLGVEAMHSRGFRARDDSFGCEPHHLL